MATSHAVGAHRRRLMEAIAYSREMDADIIKTERSCIGRICRSGDSFGSLAQDHAADDFFDPISDPFADFDLEDVQSEPGAFSEVAGPEDSSRLEMAGAFQQQGTGSVKTEPVATDTADGDQAAESAGVADDFDPTGTPDVDEQ